MIRMIVAGSRIFADYSMLEENLTKLIFIVGRNNPDLNLYTLDSEGKRFRINSENIEIISGKAEGADSLGEKFARKFGINVKEFPAKWDDFTVEKCSIGKTRSGKKYNKLAGHNRNSEMADYATKDDSFAILALFWDGKSKGSKNMKKEALNRKMHVSEFLVSANRKEK